ncbi:uncharacterized protein PG986_011825 [Apiospora aurea]|uniref:FAD dependent oxidoreductase domain-containing protein n=1 Tax=Apiospora aurea TaxID=335848 RepID=A0ABR1PYT2_9PEZI
MKHVSFFFPEPVEGNPIETTKMLEIMASGLRRGHADATVNATGLAGTELAGDDSCYQIRGGTIRVVNDGRDFPMIDAALTISANAAHSANGIVFLVPRNGDVLLIGGITESHVPHFDLTLDSPIARRMRARCEASFPDLKMARLDADYPLAQRLRPSASAASVWSGSFSYKVEGRITMLILTPRPPPRRDVSSTSTVAAAPDVPCLLDAQGTWPS